MAKKDFTLIVPLCKNNGDEFSNAFMLDNNGISNCVKSIMNLPLDTFTNIYFVILKSVNEKYKIKELLFLQLTRLNINAKIVVLNDETKSQAETIYNTIRFLNIENNAICIKDGDGMFTINTIPTSNSIATYQIENMDVLYPKNKSYVDIDDNFNVTNIIEKRVISNFINAGGYVFNKGKDFCDAYDVLNKINIQDTHLYISHIIYKMMLDGKIFKPLMVDNFIEL